MSKIKSRTFIDIEDVEKYLNTLASWGHDLSQYFVKIVPTRNHAFTLLYDERLERPKNSIFP